MHISRFGFRRPIAGFTFLVSALCSFAAETGGTWTTSAPYPLFVSEHGAAVLDNKIYVAGGFAGSGATFTGTTSAFYVYDPATDRWSSLPPVPKKLQHFGMAALGGKIYVTGGYTDDDFDLNNKSAYAFDPRAGAGGSWSPIADLPAERAAHASVSVGGLLYIVGGVGSDAATIRAYNPATNAWDSGRAPLPTPREHLTAAVVNDRIYVISGRWTAGNVGTVEEYDPVANHWTARASIPTPRSGITSGVIDGRIHVTAGEGQPSGETLASHEVYDPATNTWATLPAMPSGRHGLASGVVNDRWYVIGGGLQEGGGTFNSLTNTVEVFTPASAGPGGSGASVGRITNVSVLTTLAAPGDSFSLGFVVGGEGTEGARPLLVRAAGPSLAPFIGNGVLDDPRLELFSGANWTGENDNWGGSTSLTTAMASVGAFALTSASSRDAALLDALPRGTHSVRVSAAGSGLGAVLAEIYEVPSSSAVSTTPPRLVNVSVLKPIGAGLTVGFVITGGSRPVLIRAVGPTLGTAPFSFATPAADPQFVLFSGTTRIAENNDWAGNAALATTFTEAGAFALPANSRDAALTTTLAPGNYSVQVTSTGASTGTTLVEVYELR
jgi:N-acetylneuraminic acid mutarotase